VASPELCPNCGGPLSSGTCLRCAERSSRIVRRDILLLVLLSAIAVALFLFTRAMAAKVREMDARVAAAWFGEGERQVRTGDMGSAIDSFRKATSSCEATPGKLEFVNLELGTKLAPKLAV